MIIVGYLGLALGVAIATVLLFTPMVRTIALKWGGLKWGGIDLPDERKVHCQPMVRLGGIAIFVATLMGLAALYLVGGFNQESNFVPLLPLLLGGSSFFLLGVVDDVQGLPSLRRLWIECGLSILVWCLGIRIDFIMLPEIGLVSLGILSLPVTVLWLTGIVNAINWIDGLDGLASGVTAIVSLSILGICLYNGQLESALVSATLAGSLIGFLRYNFNPAQIFMGDGGAYFIGFMIASLSIVGLVKSTIATAIFAPFVILAVPIVDMSSVIIIRLRKGCSPFKADNSHLHHRLLRYGLPHRWTVLVIYALTLWASSWGFAVMAIPNGPLVLIIATNILIGTSWRAWQLAQQA